MTTNPILRNSLYSTVDIIEDDDKKAKMLQLITTLFTGKLEKIELEDSSENQINVKLQFSDRYLVRKISIPAQVTFTLMKTGYMWFNDHYRAPVEKFVQDTIYWDDCWESIEPKGENFEFFSSWCLGIRGYYVAGGTPRRIGEFKTIEFIDNLKPLEPKGKKNNLVI